MSDCLVVILTNDKIGGIKLNTRNTKFFTKGTMSFLPKLKQLLIVNIVYWLCISSLKIRNLMKDLFMIVI